MTEDSSQKQETIYTNTIVVAYKPEKNLTFYFINRFGPLFLFSLLCLVFFCVIFSKKSESKAKEKEKKKLKRQMFCIKYIKMYTHTRTKCIQCVFREEWKKNQTHTLTNLNAVVKMKLNQFLYLFRFH